MKNKTQKTNVKKNHSIGKRLLVGAGIFLLSVSSGFAFVMPVYDAANQGTQISIASTQETNRGREFLQTMQQWATQLRNIRDQYQHGREVWNQVDQMRGNWRGTLQRLSDQAFVRAVIGEEGRDLVRLGWELRNGPGDIETLPDQALDALDRIEKVMTNKRTPGNFLQNGDPTVREDLQEIFGQVPGNRADIELAHRTIGRAASTIAGINKAIEERRQNIEQWKQRIAAGGLVPGDLERLQAMINTEQQDIQLLNTRLVAVNTEVQIANTGLLTASESDKEISRARAENQAATFITGAGRLTPESEETQGNRTNFRSNLR